MPSKERRILRRNVVFLYIVIALALFSSGVFLRKESLETPPTPTTIIQPKEPGEPSPLFEPKETPANIPAKQIVIETPLGNTVTIEETGFPDRTCLITDYGAIKGGKVSNTDAFGKSIDDCSSSGGGIVIVPSGIWLSGPIHLKSNVNLHLKKGAKILFSTDFNEYLPTVFSRFEGIEYYNYSSPIYTLNAVNVAITGEGTLDGQGPAWWKIGKWKNSIQRLYNMGDTNVPISKRVFGTVEAALRPSFIEFVNCRDVLVEGVNIINGPMWTIHPLYSTNVIIRNVNINTNPGPSTDGVAVDSSRNVLIENSTFSTGDDAIVLKSGRNADGLRVHAPTENIVIRNCIIWEAHAAVSIGSEMSGDVRNVSISSISANNVQYGLRIKSTRGRGGVVENVYVDGIEILRKASIAVIQVTTSYEDSIRANIGAAPLIRNIHVQNVSTERSPKRSDRSIDIQGLPEQPITGISFKNMSLNTQFGINIEDAEQVSLNNIAALPKEGAIFSIANSAHIRIADMKCPLVQQDCLFVSGQRSEDIDIRNSNFSRNSVTLSENTCDDAIIAE